MGERELTKALAYFRTSSASNSGIDKDSLARQREAVAAYAGRAGYQVVGEYYDAAVSGADPIDQRPGFAGLLGRIAGNGVRTILVESPDRFARDLIVQLTGHDRLKAMGVDLIPASAPDHFKDDTPTATLIRQVLGAVAEFDRAQLVAKLKGARDRRASAAGKRLEGRKGYDDTNPHLVQEARRLARKSPKTGKARSLRQIAAELATAGYVTAKGTEFSPTQVKRLLGYAVLSE
jgi:DNA invertase Pin-like site-specific DNA recombinase